MENAKSTITFPLNLCDWVAPETLCSWLEQELKQAKGQSGVGSARPLMAVLAFAYARGVFDSEEILGLCRTDKLYAYLCGGTDFSWDDMLTARHQNRGLLVTLMVHLLTRAVLERYSISASALDPALKRRLHESAVDRLDNARNMDRGEEE